ncbi:DNA repair protein RAD50-like [Tribolium madens]|uniref:DNA repair protein RAD50-like n=1 Tax=Tribolium madens TaxID=41895 RepID=UPI001CF72964|nr:DNA repair protein RAD50-like [Tribolium madens]
MSIILWIFYCFYFCYTDATSNSKFDQRKCYQNVNSSFNELIQLIDLFNSTSFSVNVSKIYDLNNFEKDINELQKIEKDTRKIEVKQDSVFKKLDDTELNIIKDQNLVDEILQKLSNFSNYNNSINEILKEANIYKNNIEDSVRIGKNVSKLCQQGRNKYEELKSILNGLVRNYNDVAKMYDNEVNRTQIVNERVDDVIKEIEKVKKDFDAIKLPINLVENYINDSEEKLQHIIAYLKNNTNTLKELLRDSSEKFNQKLINNADAVAKSISEIQNNVNQMNIELNKYEKTFIKSDNFQPTVDKESEKLLRDISAELADLEKTFDGIDFTEEEKKIILKDDIKKYLADIREKKLLLKEYMAVLDVVPSEEEIKKIKKEIKYFQDAIESHEKLHKLESELDGLADVSEQIKNTSCNITSGLPT